MFVRKIQIYYCHGLNSLDNLKPLCRVYKMLQLSLFLGWWLRPPQQSRANISLSLVIAQTLLKPHN